MKDIRVFTSLTELLGSPDEEKKPLRIEELASCSSAKCLEAAFAMEIKLLPPFGYEETVSFYRQREGRIPMGQCPWVLIEARIAGCLAELGEEFPYVEPQAMAVIRLAKDYHRETIHRIVSRVRRPGYVFDPTPVPGEGFNDMLFGFFEEGPDD